MTAFHRISILGAALVAIGTYTSSAQAATAVWDFNLPATATSSQTPPYESVATLTLKDTSAGVLFTLDPNQSNSGYEANSTVNALNIAYQGVDLISTAYLSVSGPVAASFSAQVSPPPSELNLDSSYKVPNVDGNGQVLMTWNNPDFNVTDISVWTIAGTTIAGNFSLLAESNSNPSPTIGIFSVSPISLDGIQPTPSNWVTGVPIPAAAWLFGSALIGLAGIARKKKAA